MATANGNMSTSDYIAGTSSDQDAQLSPFAMLEAICSKIGSPAQSEEQLGDAGSWVVGAGQGGSFDAITGWVQLQNGTIVDSTGKHVNKTNVVQQATTRTNGMGGHLFAQGQQILATQGPNGQLTYNVMPSYPTVNIDEQEAFIIPSSGVASQAQVSATPVQTVDIDGQEAFTIPSSDVSNQAQVSATPVQTVNNDGQEAFIIPSSGVASQAQVSATPVQTVNIDGQEAFIIPSSGVASQAQVSATPSQTVNIDGQETFIIPSSGVASQAQVSATPSQTVNIDGQEAFTIPSSDVSSQAHVSATPIQTVNIDGQEAFIIPSSGVASQAQVSTTPVQTVNIDGQEAFIIPSSGVASQAQVLTTPVQTVNIDGQEAFTIPSSDVSSQAQVSATPVQTVNIYGQETFIIPSSCVASQAQVSATPVQTVNIDGQEAFIIPSSGVASQAQVSATPVQTVNIDGQEAFIIPSSGVSSQAQVLATPVQSVNIDGQEAFIIPSSGVASQAQVSATPVQTVNIDGQEAFIIPSSGVASQAQVSATPVQTVNIDGQEAFIIPSSGVASQAQISATPVQTVNIDGQEAFIIPSSGVASQAQVSTTPVQTAQQALITPTGQIIRVQGLLASNTPTTNLFQNVATFGSLGNLVNIGDNISIGGMQGAVRQNSNIMQTGQIPGFQTIHQVPSLIQVSVSINGQTVTIQLPTQNIPIQTPIQQVSGGGLVTLGTSIANPQTLQTFMASQAQIQTSQTPSMQTDESQNTVQALKPEAKVSSSQLNNPNTGQSSKLAGLTLSGNRSGIQTLNVINTPQGQQVILSSPTSQSQVSQSLPTLTVPSYPQAVATNTSSAPATTTSSSTQNAAMLHNVITQQQLLQGMASAQSLGGIQLANQGQVNRLQHALNMQTPRMSGVQAIQLQNLQGIQNLHTFPALQRLQNLQGIQALAQQGQIINNASVPNLGAVAIGTPGGTIGSISLNTAKTTVQTTAAALGGQQGVIAAAQIQQDPNDPTKWQIVSNTTPVSPSVSAATPLSVSSPLSTVTSGMEATPYRWRGRRVTCPCLNCTSAEKHTRENKKKQHICHIPGCGKVYVKTSHLLYHLRWHSGDRPFVCNWLFCGKQFTRLDDLQRHRQTHTAAAQIQQDPNDPTKWQIVSNTTPVSPSVSAATPLSVSSPLSTVTSGMEATPYRWRGRRVTCPCLNCTSAEKHTRENKKKQHICHIPGCGKVYVKTSHLLYHLRWHSGDRPFVCNWLFCGKQFTRLDDLQRHRQTHTGLDMESHVIGEEIDDEGVDEEGNEAACIIDADTKVYRVSMYEEKRR